MSAVQQDEQLVMRQVIRGERPWTDLQSVGIGIRLETGRCVLENPPHITAPASIADLARGFLAHRHDPRALREWAFVVEAIDASVDVENHPHGDLVMRTVWDASFGNPVDASVVQIMEQLAQNNGKEPI